MYHNSFEIDVHDTRSSLLSYGLMLSTFVVQPNTGCKYARLYTFLSHGAIFEDNFNLHLILLELRSFFFQIFFYLLDMLHVKILCALLLS